MPEWIVATTDDFDEWFTALLRTPGPLKEATLQKLQCALQPLLLRQEAAFLPFLMNP